MNDSTSKIHYNFLSDSDNDGGHRRHYHTPKVYNNKKNDTPPDDAVYVGRPSKWGNPFIVGKHGSRDDVIAMYKAYMNEHPELCRDARNELRGKSLVCWCAPKPCHADVLIEIANSPVDTEHKDVL